MVVVLAVAVAVVAVCVAGAQRLVFAFCASTVAAFAHRVVMSL